MVSLSHTCPTATPTISMSAFTTFIRLPGFIPNILYPNHFYIFKVHTLFWKVFSTTFSTAEILLQNVFMY